MKGQGRGPNRLVTDRLKSYSAAHREMMPSVPHDTSRWSNNRAEVSHEAVRHRERQLRRFKSAETCPAFPLCPRCRRESVPGGSSESHSGQLPSSAKSVLWGLAGGDVRLLRTAGGSRSAPLAPMTANLTVPTRILMPPTTGQACLADARMWGTEGTMRRDRHAARATIDLSDLGRLLIGHRRQEIRQTPGQHRLAGSGRSDKQDGVATGGGDFHRPLRGLLALDVGQLCRRVQR